MILVVWFDIIQKYIEKFVIICEIFIVLLWFCNISCVSL